ncbi:MAG: GumC family protein [Planctomycetota bacterium]|jgi:uncharacterized protein involved in exopolysaccharide biosynthesis
MEKGIRIEDGVNSTFSLRDFYYILFRHKVSIIIICFAALFTVIAGVYMWSETYEAKCILLVKLGRENISIAAVAPLSKKQVVNMGLRKEDINSEIKMLNNKSIIEKLVREVGTDFLYPRATRPETLSKRIKYELRMALGKVRDFINEILYRIDLKKRLSLYDKTVLAVQKKLSAKQISNSDLIEVRFKWSNPDIAEEVLGTLIDFYLVHHLEAHKTSGGYTFFHKQVEVLEGRLKDSEDRLYSLKEGEEITSYEVQSRFLLEQINNFKASLKTTETELAEATTRVHELKGQLSSLRKEITTGFNTVYKAAEKELLLEEVRSKALGAKREKLEQHIESYQNDLNKLNAYDTELKRLERQIQINEQNYKLYRKELEEARISDVLDTEGIVNVKLIDPPAASFKPIRPRKLLTIGLGVILSVIFAMGFAFLSEYLDHSIKTPEDVRRYLDLHLLASIREMKR